MKGSRNAATSFLASQGAKFLIALPLVLAAFALMLQVRAYPHTLAVCLHPATVASRSQRCLEAPECRVVEGAGFVTCRQPALSPWFSGQHRSLRIKHLARQLARPRMLLGCARPRWRAGAVLQCL